MAGMARQVYLPDWIRYYYHPIPTTQFRQRPGYKLWGGVADGSTDHETGNPNYAADAEMHDRYMHNGAPNNKGEPQYLSYHFSCDGGSVSRGKQPTVAHMIPLDEVTWQA